MLHLYAALAEKERRLIFERTRAALAAKRANGARLGNPSNIQVAGSLGRSVQTTTADAFVAGLLPVIASSPNFILWLDASPMAAPVTIQLG